MVNQTNLNLKNINDIIEALKTDKQLFQDEKIEYIGSGILKSTDKKINKKYFFNMDRLNNNVLEVRYNKNRHLTGIKTQIIGSGVKILLVTFLMMILWMKKNIIL